MWCRLAALALAVAALTSPAAVSAGSMTVITRFADASCTSVPTQVAFNVSSAACDASNTMTCTSTGSSANSYYARQMCSVTTVDVAAAAKTLFAATASPYVLVEIYRSDASCSSESFVSAVAFLADAKCLVVDNGDSSIQVSVNADGSALLETFSGASCSGTATKRNAIPSASVAGKECVNGALKFYTSAVATTTISTGTSDGPRNAALSTATTFILALVAAAAIY